MILALALAVAAAAAVPEDLGAAADAFARGDYAQAEALALAGAQPPRAGEALNLAGLARFRQGRPAEALEALDRAGQAADPPEAGRWHYNRASCLYELERFADAEAAFLQAAALDPSLAAVSLANAGFAALDAGAPRRARELAARARAADGAAVELAADLEQRAAAAEREQATQAYREALAAFDAGRFAEARERFLRAAALDPADGASRVMAGAAALQLGDRAGARAELDQALALRLDEAAARAARGYLDALARPADARLPGWDRSASLAAGWDSDALQSGGAGMDRAGMAASGTPSPLASAELALAWRPDLPGSLQAEASYSFSQLAYLRNLAADRSVQAHALTASLEARVGAALRVGGALGGQAAFTGLSSFRGLQAQGSAGLWAALDESPETATRLDLEGALLKGLAEFDYLGGGRLAATLSQELRLEAVTLGLGYRLRGELLGSYAAPWLSPRDPPCDPSCTQDVTPFAWLGHAVWLSARAPLGTSWLLEASAGFELRSYLEDNTRWLKTAGGTVSLIARQRREDQRWFAGASAAFALTRALSLTLRYDLVLNRSNIAARTPDSGPACGMMDPACTFRPDNYDKHVLTLGSTFAW